MNLLHMKYAVEVARVGSINKAAEVLLIAQPNLSRAVKELEEDLGIVIFNRGARGMTLTQSGEEFISRAEKILEKIDEVECIYKAPQKRAKRLAVCGISPHYVLRAFSKICTSDKQIECERSYVARTVADTVRSVGRGEYRLGVVRVLGESEQQFEAFLAEQGLEFEPIAAYRLVVLANKRGHIARDRGQSIGEGKRLTYLFAFGEKPEVCVTQVDSTLSCLEMLSADDTLYAYSPPLPERLPKAYGVCEACVSDIVCRDGLIYKRGMHFNVPESLFRDELIRTRSCIKTLIVE